LVPISATRSPPEKPPRPSCGAAAEAAGTRVDVELTVQDGTLHVWLGLDKVDVRAACDVFANLLSPHPSVHRLPGR
jgi:hypothetical protein